ncbi:hypothetical protein ABPG72_008603 [Tetrahymena utriculariae]
MLLQLKQLLLTIKNSIKFSFFFQHIISNIRILFYFTVITKLIKLLVQLNIYLFLTQISHKIIIQDSQSYLVEQVFQTLLITITRIDTVQLQIVSCMFLFQTQRNQNLNLNQKAYQITLNLTSNQIIFSSNVSELSFFLKESLILQYDLSNETRIIQSLYKYNSISEKINLEFLSFILSFDVFLYKQIKRVFLSNFSIALHYFLSVNNLIFIIFINFLK